MIVRVQKYGLSALVAGGVADHTPVGIVVPEELAWYVTAVDLTPFQLPRYRLYPPYCLWHQFAPRGIIV